MRTGQDDSVGQEGQGHFRMKYHIGEWQEAIVQDERFAAARPEEKLSRMSRSNKSSWNTAKRTGSAVNTVLPFFIPAILRGSFSY